MKAKRNIVEINENLCNGCGQCILDCAEGAIALVDGKAKVISDMLCDGLGACLGGCPTGALKIIQREADAYDEDAVEKHLAAHGRVHVKDAHHGAGHHAEGHACKGHHHEGHACKGHHGESHAHPTGHKHGGCPGSRAAVFSPAPPKVSGCPSSQSQAFGHMPGHSVSATHWPLKLRLMSPDAPFLQGADLVIAADCTAFAAPSFHKDLRSGKVLLIACPKFEEQEETISRLAAVFRSAKSCTVARMEVPCCKSLMHLCLAAKERAGRPDLPLHEVVITRQGDY